MPLLVFFRPTTLASATHQIRKYKIFFMVKILNINELDKLFRGWRVAFASVVGRKNTNNGTICELITDNCSLVTDFYLATIKAFTIGSAPVSIFTKYFPSERLETFNSISVRDLRVGLVLKVLP